MFKRIYESLKLLLKKQGKVKDTFFVGDRGFYNTEYYFVDDSGLICKISNNMAIDTFRGVR